MKGEGRDSAKFANLTGMILLASAILQVLFMHYALGFPHQVANPASSIAGSLITAGAGALLYSLVYLLVYRPIRDGKTAYVAVTGIGLGLFCILIISFAILGLSLLAITILNSLRESKLKGVLKKTRPQEVRFNQPQDGTAERAFAKALRLRHLFGLLNSINLCVALIPLVLLLLNFEYYRFHWNFSYGLTLWLFLVEMATMVSGLLVSTAKSNLISGPMLEVYQALPGMTGTVKSCRRGKYSVFIEGFNLRATSTSDLHLGTTVNVKEVKYNTKLKMGTLVVEPF